MIIIPLYRVGVPAFNLAEAIKYGCPVPAEDDESTIVSRFFVDPAIIDNLYR